MDDKKKHYAEKNITLKRILEEKSREKQEISLTRRTLEKENAI